MKKLLVVLAFLSTLFSEAQEKKKPKLKSYLAVAGLALVSGASDGINQKISFHYHEFKALFPGANDQFWDPALSWTNKYKNHDPAQGAKFPLSTTILVWTTDGYHLTRFISNATTATSVVISLGDKKRWWVYVVEAIGYWSINRVGFNLTYKL